MAYTTAPVLAGEPVIRVLHDEDGDLQFFGATEIQDVADGRVVHLHHLLDDDPTLHEVLTMPREHAAAREHVGGPWTITPEELRS